MLMMYVCWLMYAVLNLADDGSGVENEDIIIMTADKLPQTDDIRQQADCLRQTIDKTDDQRQTTKGAGSMLKTNGMSSMTADTRHQTGDIQHMASGWRHDIRPMTCYLFHNLQLVALDDVGYLVAVRAAHEMGMLHDRDAAVETARALG